MYTASPRPTFNEPTAIPRQAATRHLWGDTSSGEVEDWIYVSSDKIHQLLFGLPPGGWFRHSDSYRTVFAADEVLYVLSGCMVVANPETGEVYRLPPGQAAFFRRDTWHHVYSYGSAALRVLELFAPPPSQGTSGAYARKQPFLSDIRYTQDEIVGNWPMRRVESDAKRTIQVISEESYGWRLEGDADPILVGLLVSTEHLTAGKLLLRPGQQSQVRSHDGDESLYVLEGVLNVRTHDGGPPNWFELHPGDGFYLPQGTPYQYYNMGSEMVGLLFGVAPSYKSGRTPG